MRSGEKATKTSRPGRRPRSISGCASSSLRAPHVGGAREHDHLVAARVCDHGLAGGAQHPQVRLEPLVHRRRDADHDCVRGLECTGARREHELVELECGLQALPLTRREVHAALTDVLQPPVAHVDPGYLCPRGRQADPRRQPDVSESQHRNRTSARISLAGNPGCVCATPEMPAAVAQRSARRCRALEHQVLSESRFPWLCGVNGWTDTGSLVRVSVEGLKVSRACAGPRRAVCGRRAANDVDCVPPVGTRSGRRRSVTALHDLDRALALRRVTCLRPGGAGGDLGVVPDALVLAAEPPEPEAEASHPCDSDAA